MPTLNEFLNLLAGDKSCIWIFNIDAEKIWFSTTNFISNDSVDFLAGIESINFFLCRNNDYIILRKYPNKNLLDHLQRQGISIPHIIIPEVVCNNMSISECILRDNKLLNSLSKLKSTCVLCPYAVTKFEEKISQKTGLKIMNSNEKEAKLVNSKVFSRQFAQNLNYNVCEGKIFKNICDAYDYYKKHLNDTKVILKNSYGSSGKGLYIIENDRQFESIIKRAEYLKILNECILEKFYEDKIDMNYQIFISDQGDVSMLSIKQQIVKTTKYIGSIYPPKVDIKIINDFKIYGLEIGKKLYKNGYWGIASIDAMITNNKIIPIVEINGRMSLSTYTSFCCDSLSYKIVITKYYDYYVQNKYLINSSELFNLIESSNDIFTKTIIYACSSETKLGANNKYKYRIYVMYLGNNYELIDKKINFIEERIKLLLL